MFSKVKSGLQRIGTAIKNKAIQIKGRLTGQKRIGTEEKAGAGGIG